MAGRFSAKVFAGQRAEGFYVDLGAVFDLGDLRPFAGLHAGGPMAGLMNGMPGVNSTADVNVHSLALQIPISQLTASSGGRRHDDPSAVIGVWTTASRQRVRVDAPDPDDWVGVGPWTQVSRLGNPLVNEVIIGIGDKNAWNRQPPVTDGHRFFHYFDRAPAGLTCSPGLYPGVFPNLAAYNGGSRPHPTRHRGHPAHRHPGRGDPRASPTTTAPASKPTSCASTPPSRPPPVRATWVCSATTSPAFPTAGGSSTTSPPSNCVPSPAPPCPWSSRPSPPMARPARSTSA